MPGSPEREVPMFSAEEIQSIDKKYFNIIAVNEYDVTIMSRNTGHFWYLHNPEYPERGTASSLERLASSSSLDSSFILWHLRF